MRLLGVAWRVAPRAVDEASHLLADALLGALSVALAKARAAAGALGSAEIALAADTLVVLDGRALGKPADGAQARAMLAALRGRPHTVATGVALRDASGQEWGAVVSTRVHLRAYSDADVERYVERGEPFDKAGAYAIQDRAFHPVERHHGCYLNVVGLPLCAVARGLQTLGLPVPSQPEPFLPPCSYCRAGEALMRSA